MIVRAGEALSTRSPSISARAVVSRKGVLFDNSNDKEDAMDDVAKETPETPTPLPADVMGGSRSASSSDLPLHLRVVGLIVQGQADEDRLEQALEIAHEIYELETARVALEEYRSAS
jgi:hypothetical protein